MATCTALRRPESDITHHATYVRRHPQMKPQPGQRRRAFTLPELLVASTILSIIVVTLAGIASQAGRMWTDVNAQNQRRSTGRAMLQFIARDLEMATLQTSAASSASSSTSPSPSAASSPLPHL